MKHVFAIAIGLVAAAGIETAHASSCGGGGGSSGGGSSGGGSSGGGGSSSSSSSSSDYSSSDSSSSSSSVDLKPACVETTDIHGYRECQGFGRWRQPPIASMFFEVGTAVRQFQNPFGTRTAAVSHLGENFLYRVVDGGGGGSTSEVPLDTAGVFQLRTGFHFAHGLYAGVEGEAGALTNTSATATMSTTMGEHGAASLTQTGVTVLGGALIAGVHGRIHNVIGLGAELAGGVRMLSYNYESHYGACELTTSVTTSSMTLEARARASLWVSPWASLGAVAGKSLSDEGWMAGVFLNGNTRAFGGR